MIKQLIIILLALFLTCQNIIAQHSAPNESEQHKELAGTPLPDEINRRTVSQKINDFFVPIVDAMSKVLFFDPFAILGIYDPVIRDEWGQVVLDEKGNPRTSPISLVVVWLIFGAVFCTLFFRFINISGFWHSLQVVRGKYDNAADSGEVSHFQALATALSATVGLGNIAGVAIAISLGGPGATFWMIVAGLLGMSSKFVECTLGVKYRKINPDGSVSGGPMYYLSKGLKKRNLGGLGKVLAALFALLVIGGSIGGGNMFQANQSFSQLSYILPAVSGYGAWYGLFLAILVGVVIIGGIKSIARVTSKLVPFMVVLYILAAMIIIFIHIENTPYAIRLIIDGAFNPGALKGGVIGVLIIGFQRAAFSNEAGIGSAPIAHSAVKTEEPVSEGFVSLLEPFIDTVVICTMTALVLIFTGMYHNPLGLEGSALTSEAFKSVIAWFPYVLMIAIFLFAFSTMISWSYYGLKGFDYLVGGLCERTFGSRKVSDTVYRVFFLVCIIIGSASELGAVLDFSDMMILSMAFPNILGMIIMAPEIRRDVASYLKRIKSGEIKAYR